MRLLLCLASAAALSTLHKPDVAARAARCVDRVQRALDVAVASEAVAPVARPPLAAEALSTARGAADFRERLEAEHYCVVKLADGGACARLREAAKELLKDDERLQRVGPATPVAYRVACTNLVKHSPRCESRQSLSSTRVEQ